MSLREIITSIDQTPPRVVLKESPNSNYLSLGVHRILIADNTVSSEKPGQLLETCKKAFGETVEVIVATTGREAAEKLVDETGRKVGLVIVSCSYNRNDPFWDPLSLRLQSSEGSDIPSVGILLSDESDSAEKEYLASLSLRMGGFSEMLPSAALTPSTLVLTVEAAIASVTIRNDINQTHRSHDISQQLLEIMGLDINRDEQLQKALEAIINLPGIGSLGKGVIGLLNPDMPGYMEIVASVNYPDALKRWCEGTLIVTGQCICFECLRVGEIVRSYSLEDPEHPHVKVEDVPGLEMMDPHGHECIPLRGEEGEVIGLLNLYNIATERAFVDGGKYLFSRGRRVLESACKALEKILAKADTKKREEAYINSNRRQQKRFENIPVGLITTDKETKKITLLENDKLSKMTGYSNNELRRMLITDLIVKRHTPELEEEIKIALKRDGEWAGEKIWLRQKDGTPFLTKMQIVYYREDGILNWDITDIREIADSAFTDLLTGLGNRRMFEGLQLPRAWSISRQHLKENSGKVTAYMLGDLNFLKWLNDRTKYGYDAGDEGIKVCAAGLRAGFSGKDDAIACVGGDEFKALKVLDRGVLNPFQTVLAGSSKGIQINGSNFPSRFSAAIVYLEDFGTFNKAHMAVQRLLKKAKFLAKGEELVKDEKRVPSLKEIKESNSAFVLLNKGALIEVSYHPKGKRLRQRNLEDRRNKNSDRRYNKKDKRRRSAGDNKSRKDK